MNVYTRWKPYPGESMPNVSEAVDEYLNAGRLVRRCWLVGLCVLVGGCGGCTVSSEVNVSDGCRGHRGVLRVERGVDQDGHERPLMMVCVDGSWVDLR